MMIWSFFVEHVGYASRCSNASVSFGESASYVCCGTVLVVGQSLYDDRDTIRAITFVGDTLVVVCVCISGSFF